MQVNKIILSKLLVVLLLVAFAGTLFAACGNKVDEATISAVNDYFKGSEVEVRLSFGKYKDATVVLVKSQSIEDSLRKDTINGIEFNYANQTQLLVVRENRVFTLKEAYLNLVVDSAILRDVQTTYNKKIKLESSSDYTEIGIEIVLEKKSIWDESDLDITHFEYLDDTINISVDKNFKDYSFGASDFTMLDIKSIHCIYEGAFYPGTDALWLHRVYSIKLNNPGRENLKNAIRTLEQLDFVQSAYLNFLGKVA